MIMKAHMRSGCMESSSWGIHVTSYELRITDYPGEGRLDHETSCNWPAFDAQHLSRNVLIV